MKYTTAIAAAFAAGASASYAPGWSAPAGGYTPQQSWVTQVLTAYTTFCPEATQITHGSTTISVTAPTTVTITGPVTVTVPVTVSTTASVSSAAPPPPPPSSAAPPPPPYSKPAPPLSTAPAHSVIPAPSPVYSVPNNGTIPKPSGTGAPTHSAPVYTGAASALKAGSGLAAVLGFAAYAL